MDVMKMCVTLKFQDNEALKMILLSTGTKPLVNNSTDAFWGIGTLQLSFVIFLFCITLMCSRLGEDRQGGNHLGLLLMDLRLDYANELSISEI
jgi:predicted NAD-dependent protein-ADP-ribosyltransferase YbiA (DUF1768 family)